MSIFSKIVSGIKKVLLPTDAEKRERRRIIAAETRKFFAAEDLRKGVHPEFERTRQLINAYDNNAPRVYEKTPDSRLINSTSDLYANSPVDFVNDNTTWTGGQVLPKPYEALRLSEPATRAFPSAPPSTEVLSPCNSVVVDRSAARDSSSNVSVSSSGSYTSGFDVALEPPQYSFMVTKDAVSGLFYCYEVMRVNGEVVGIGAVRRTDDPFHKELYNQTAQNYKPHSIRIRHAYPCAKSNSNSTNDERRAQISRELERTREAYLRQVGSQLPIGARITLSRSNISPCLEYPTYPTIGGQTASSRDTSMLSTSHSVVSNVSQSHSNSTTSSWRYVQSNLTRQQDVANVIPSRLRSRPSEGGFAEYLSVSRGSGSARIDFAPAA